MATMLKPPASPATKQTRRKQQRDIFMTPPRTAHTSKRWKRGGGALLGDARNRAPFPAKGTRGADHQPNPGHQLCRTRKFITRTTIASAPPTARPSTQQVTGSG